MRYYIHIMLIVFLNIVLSQCDDNMLMFDCDGQEFCNNEATFGFDM